MVVLDDGIAAPPRTLGLGPLVGGLLGGAHSRLLMLETRGQTVREVVKVRRTGTHPRVALIHRGEGEYVLVRANKLTASYTAYAFRLANDGSVQWIGKRESPGEMLDDPIRTPQGILLPIARHGKHDLEYVRTDPCHDAPDEL
jgi:hypothetical protein